MEHEKAPGKAQRYVRDLIEALPAAIYMIMRRPDHLLQ